MTTGSVARHILDFTIPIAIGNVLQQVYNMTDTAIVGHALGPQALAAVGSTGTIMFLVTGFAQGMTNGFAVLTSQRFGAGDNEGVRRSVASGLALSLLCTVGLTVGFSVFMRKMLTMMHTPDDIYDMAYIYILIIALGIVTTILYNLFSGFLRAVGNSRAPLVFLIISATLNTILDLWMIIGLHMGVAGAAWATVISQGVSAFLCLAFLLKKVRMLIPLRGEWRPKREHVRFQMTMGLLMAMQYGITAIGTMIMQGAINLFGSTAVAAFTAASKIQSIVTQPMPAIGTTMANFCGQNWGKHTLSRIKKGLVLLTRNRYPEPDAMGGNLYLPFHAVLYSAFDDFHLPEQSRGLRVCDAHRHQRHRRAGRAMGHGDHRDPHPQLPAFRRGRSGRVVGRGHLHDGCAAGPDQAPGEGTPGDLTSLLWTQGVNLPIRRRAFLTSKPETVAMISYSPL